MSKPAASHVATETHRSAGIDQTALAAAAAILAAAVMLLLGIFGRVGIYVGAVEMMEQWHLFFQPTFGGTLAGMVEAAVVSFALAWLFGWLYNGLARR
ncbi:MAG TPA: hypothetical protein VMM12_17495 [Longimicrobiales bacterium]|nr:hypothetical protein [Longimicrobiales bacterium]